MNYTSRQFFDPSSTAKLNQMTMPGGPGCPGNPTRVRVSDRGRPHAPATAAPSTKASALGSRRRPAMTRGYQFHRTYRRGAPTALSSSTGAASAGWESCLSTSQPELRVKRVAGNFRYPKTKTEKLPLNILRIGLGVKSWIPTSRPRIEAEKVMNQLSRP